MKILYCITKSTWGGAQAHLFGLIKDQCQRGSDVVVVVGERGEFEKRIERDIGEARVIILDSLRRSINPWFDIRCICALRKIIKTEQPDIVHLHSTKAGAVGRIAARGLNAKVVYTVHGWAFTNGVGAIKGFVYTKIERALSPLADKILLVSKYDKELGIKNRVIDNSVQSEVVYNGVDERLSQEKKLIRHEGNVELVMTARFSPQKNQALLIKAMKNVQGVHLTLVGDGPLLSEDVKLARDNELLSKISFAGFQSDVLSFLKKADGFVLITHYEGLPISIIEAMAERLPIVASNVGGISEMVNKDNGFLVGDNEVEIREDIEKLKDSAFRARLSEQSFLSFKKHFTLNTELEKINKVYLDLLA